MKKYNNNPYFKFALLYYGYPSVYFKNVKQLETQRCSLHHAFALKLVCQKIIKIDLDF